MVRRVLVVEVSGWRVGGGPRFVRMVGVKVTLGSRRITWTLRYNARNIGRSCCSLACFAEQVHSPEEKQIVSFGMQQV